MNCNNTMNNMFGTSTSFNTPRYSWCNSGLLFDKFLQKFSMLEEVSPCAYQCIPSKQYNKVGLENNFSEVLSIPLDLCMQIVRQNYWMWSIEGSVYGYPIYSPYDGQCSYTPSIWTTQAPSTKVKITKRNEKYLAELQGYDYAIEDRIDHNIGKQTVAYVCKYEGNCNQEFQRSWNLLDHIRMHYNIRPYSCSYCDFKFTQKGNLNKHMLKHIVPNV